jgi:hypothetical protein
MAADARRAATAVAGVRLRASAEADTRLLVTVADPRTVVADRTVVVRTAAADMGGKIALVSIPA